MLKKGCELSEPTDVLTLFFWYTRRGHKTEKQSTDQHHRVNGEGERRAQEREKGGKGCATIYNPHTTFTCRADPGPKNKTCTHTTHSLFIYSKQTEHTQTTYAPFCCCSHTYTHPISQKKTNMGFSSYLYLLRLLPSCRIHHQVQS